MIRRLLQLAGLACAAHLCQHAYAHEVRPGYLELQQTAPETWSVLWKVPALGDMRLAIYPQLPEACAPVSEQVVFQTDGAHVERTSIACKGGLAGHEISIRGLSA